MPRAAEKRLNRSFAFLNLLRGEKEKMKVRDMIPVITEVGKLWLSWLSKRFYYFPPKHVQIIITHRCNAKCKMCNIHEIYRLHPERLHEELSTEEWIKVFDELKELGVQIVTITGGEPLVREDIVILLKRLKLNGFKVALATNGLLLPRMVTEIWPYVDNIGVSIDAAQPKIHNSIRGINVFERAVKGIKKIKELNLVSHSTRKDHKGGVVRCRHYLHDNA